MVSDISLLFIACIIHWVILYQLIFYSLAKKRALLINIIVQIIYLTVLLYNYYYNSEGGMSLVWGFYILVSIAIHMFLNFALLIYRYYKQTKS